MDKAWLRQYPDYVPHEINPEVFESVVEIFEKSALKFADKPAFYHSGTELSYKALDSLSRNMAAYLQQVLSLKPGDRLAIMLPNLLQFPVVLFAAMRAGLVVVTINPQYTARELEYQLKDADVKALVILSDALPVYLQVNCRVSVDYIIVSMPDDLAAEKLQPAKSLPSLENANALRSVFNEGERLEFNPPSVSRNDIVFLQYTGGTSGISKGAVLTHGNIVANLEQLYSFLRPAYVEGENIIISALPLYHIFGLTVNCLNCVKVGGLNVLISNPRDMPALVTELKQWKFTDITGVNTLYNGLLNTPGFSELDFSALRLSVGGGMPILESIAARWHEVTGCVLLQGYGLSETSPAISVDPYETQSFSGNVGLPLPSTDISIRDEFGEQLPAGEAGELCIKGPQVMSDYWQQPEATREAMTEDGYFKTGDIAVIDANGYIHIVDRKKDIIIVSGFNVYPNEVELVASNCPGIFECACVGVPDERCGEAVKLFVVKDPDSHIDKNQIIAFCQTGLTRYKIPKYVEFVDNIPKSAVGKVLRRLLRDV